MKKKISPQYLGISDEAKEIFDEIASVYADKIDVKLDFAELAIYAESCVRLKRYYKESEGKSPVMQSNTGGCYLDPLQTAISMVQKQIHASEKKLGLSPASRKAIGRAGGAMGRPKKGLREKLIGRM